ncbi:MAG: hypothetical protein CSA66_03325 [Proteobacteria bacterium]|nr:MAG: hypothetical protein CSA66_03325 [Pseudomonadota bacterium]
MAENDTSNTPTDGSRKAELEALFQAWDQREGGPTEPGAREARMRLLTVGVHMRLVVSAVLIAVTAYVMYSSRRPLLYWLDGGESAALGDLRERWAAGERDLGGESNTYVSLSGMVITRVLIARGTDDDGEPLPESESDSLFFDPTFNVIVKTERKLPDPPLRIGQVEIDRRLVGLVNKRLVFPSDLTVSFDAEGRLVRGDDVPRHMMRSVNYYAERMKLPPEDLWVLIDGDTPGDHSLVVIVWGLAAIVPLVALFFLLRAIRLRAAYRRELEAAPAQTER